MRKSGARPSTTNLLSHQEQRSSRSRSGAAAADGSASDAAPAVAVMRKEGVEGTSAAAGGDVEAAGGAGAARPSEAGDGDDASSVSTHVVELSAPVGLLTEPCDAMTTAVVAASQPDTVAAGGDAPREREVRRRRCPPLRAATPPCSSLLRPRQALVFAALFACRLSSADFAAPLFQPCTRNSHPPLAPHTHTQNPPLPPQSEQAQGGSSSRTPPAVVELMEADHHAFMLKKMGEQGVRVSAVLDRLFGCVVPPALGDGTGGGGGGCGAAGSGMLFVVKHEAWGGRLLHFFQPCAPLHLAAGAFPPWPALHSTPPHLHPHPHTRTRFTALLTTPDYSSPPPPPYTRSGLLTALALFIHNFPEGLATFVGALADTKVGVGLGEWHARRPAAPPAPASPRSLGSVVMLALGRDARWSGWRVAWPAVFLKPEPSPLTISHAPQPACSANASQTHVQTHLLTLSFHTPPLMPPPPPAPPPCAAAVAIAMHNIPEGICVAMPIYYATGSRWKVGSGDCVCVCACV
jgi:zinc transporter ZupT